MSKLMKQYQELKKEDPNLIYIFQVGIFYNILNEDARIVSNEIGLKLTCRLVKHMAHFSENNIL